MTVMLLSTLVPTALHLFFALFALAAKRLLYRDDPYKFGTALRRYMGAVGLSDTLANRTVAQAVVFPQAPTSQAGSWMAKTGPKARWREFSKSWTERLVEAQRPKVVLIFGDKASGVLRHIADRRLSRPSRPRSGGSHQRLGRRQRG
jgi:hypothetical protein